MGDLFQLRQPKHFANWLNRRMEMCAIKFSNKSYLEAICINVRQQLLTSNVIATKALQLGVKDGEVTKLLDRFINEWIEHYNKNSIEAKNLTGWILLANVKRRFLNN